MVADTFFFSLQSTFVGRNFAVNNTFSGNDTTDRTAFWQHYRITNARGYMMNLASGYTYFFDWNSPPNSPVIDVTSYNGRLDYMEQEDYIIVQHQVVSAPDHFDISKNEYDLGREVTPTDFHKLVIKHTIEFN